MIEGDDGAFELLAHGWLAGSEGQKRRALRLGTKHRHQSRPFIGPRPRTRSAPFIPLAPDGGGSLPCKIALLGCGSIGLRPRRRGAPLGWSVHQKNRGLGRPDEILEVPLQGSPASCDGLIRLNGLAPAQR